MNPKLERNVFNLSKIIYLFSKNLNKDYSREEIEKKICQNYTQYWNLFFNFQIPYILRCKKVYHSIENFYVWGLCALNEALNSKKLSLKDKSDFFSNAGSFHHNVTKLKNSKGLNPTTISELSGIPRATVIRKINFLVKKNFMFKEANLYKINNKVNTTTFKVQNANFQKNQKEFRVFLKDILNLVHN